MIAILQPAAHEAGTWSGGSALATSHDNDTGGAAGRGTVFLPHGLPAKTAEPATEDDAGPGKLPGENRRPDPLPYITSLRGPGTPYAAAMLSRCVLISPASAFAMASSTALAVSIRCRKT